MNIINVWFGNGGFGTGHLLSAKIVIHRLIYKYLLEKDNYLEENKKRMRGQRTLLMSLLS